MSTTADLRVSGTQVFPERKGVAAGIERPRAATLGQMRGNAVRRLIRGDRHEDSNLLGC